MMKQNKGPITNLSVCFSFNLRWCYDQNSCNVYESFLYYNVSGGYGVAVSIPENSAYESIVLAYHLGVGSVIPFVVIVFCNFCIITTIRAAAEKRGTMGQDEKSKKNMEKETSYLTRMLVIVCIAYACLSIPYRLYDFMLMIPAIGNRYDKASNYWHWRYLFETWVLLHVWDWNYGINFYLYCIGGGRRYRSEVARMLCCKKSKA
jgi:hypothetical protein